MGGHNVDIGHQATTMNGDDHDDTMKIDSEPEAQPSPDENAATDQIQDGASNCPPLRSPKTWRDTYVEYGAGWADHTITLHDRFVRAKELALALLNHYYPPKEGFKIVEHNFSMSCAFGFAIETKEYLEISIKTVEKVEKIKVKKMEMIPPDLITGFLVKRVSDVDGNKQDRIYTILGVMVHPTSMHMNWEMWNRAKVHRGDIFTPTLNHMGKIKQAPVTLIFGNWFEFYQFNLAKDDSVVPFRDRKHENVWNNAIGPGSVDQVAAVMEDIAHKNPVYQDD